MTFNGYAVQLDYQGDVAHALQVAADTLVEKGYEVKEKGASELKLKFSGAWFTSDPAKMSHTLTIYAEGQALRFSYSTGLLASVWTESDREWATSRAREVLKAIQG